MKKLSEWKVLIFTFLTGIFAGILIFLNLTRSDESDSELSKLQSDDDILEKDTDSLNQELDGLNVEEMSAQESVEYWEDL